MGGGGALSRCIGYNRDGSQFLVAAKTSEQLETKGGGERI